MDEELRQRWAAGETGSAIAAAFGSGLSRNAIIGRANRLKLEQRESPVNRKERRG